MQQHKPDRLNLAIARRCFVNCKGCYSFFGRHEPDLEALARTVAIFVRLSIRDVTISGGDPLTIAGLLDFLTLLRTAGVRTIKVDTVGTSILFNRSAASGKSPAERKSYLDTLLGKIDYLGIPLDGWSNASVRLFREGRSALHDETIDLLHTIDTLGRPANVIINTVAHNQNFQGLDLILDELSKHRSVCHWNIFQYTPTDQARPETNTLFRIADEQFTSACNALLRTLKQTKWRGEPPTVEFRSVKSRLGKYLLINSDGNVWMPDETGCTIQLGNVFGREEALLAQWSGLVSELAENSPDLVALSAGPLLHHREDVREG